MNFSKQSTLRRGLGGKGMSYIKRYTDQLRNFLSNYNSTGKNQAFSPWF
jgi:hypothetical protein